MPRTPTVACLEDHGSPAGSQHTTPTSTHGSHILCGSESRAGATARESTAPAAARHCSSPSTRINDAAANSHATRRPGPAQQQATTCLKALHKLRQEGPTVLTANAPMVPTGSGTRSPNARERSDGIYPYTCRRGMVGGQPFPCRENATLSKPPCHGPVQLAPRDTLWSAHDEVIDAALQLMQVTPADVLADYGPVTATVVFSGNPSPPPPLTGLPFHAIFERGLRCGWWLLAEALW